MLDAVSLQRQLAHFCGTTSYAYSGLNRSVLYTDGAQYLFQEAQAYWLGDLIVSHLTNPKVASESFLHIKLTVDPETRGGLVQFYDGNNTVPVAWQSIPTTDFPLNSIELYLCEEGAQRILMLTGEY